ncbi:hypothetical protein [Pararhodobacter zhoushanensis]|uniref:Response regulatory domain-containing protein n=1 Tax=Pararhodobacter zhoushanensis TaxID=2479545 RepID=A0ABT3H0E3_9RHOB|nr:hypothetical protein [Pararhodobacter zhoushanensis]MCW1933258.1 hypothetical protein [Pararhodobacter zhoushanensis]
MIHSKAPAPDKSAPVAFSGELADARTILVVDAQQAMSVLTPNPRRQSVILTRKSMLGHKMLASVRPDVIIGPLMTQDWDIVDLALMLEALGYRGDLFAVTKPLPRAELVLREVSAVCTHLRVRLLELP